MPHHSYKKSMAHPVKRLKNNKNRNDISKCISMPTLEEFENMIPSSSKKRDVHLTDSSSSDSSSSDEEHVHKPNAPAIAVEVCNLPSENMIEAFTEYEKRIKSTMEYIERFNDTIIQTYKKMLDRHFFQRTCDHTCSEHPPYKKMRGRPSKKK